MEQAEGQSKVWFQKWETVLYMTVCYFMWHYVTPKVLNKVSCFPFCWFTDVWCCGACREWVIRSLTLPTSLCLNSPTSQPLVNVAISILAFALFVLFACVIHVALQLHSVAQTHRSQATKRFFHCVTLKKAHEPSRTVAWAGGVGRNLRRGEHPQQIFSTCCLPFPGGQKLTFHWSHYRQWHFINQDLS